MRRLRRRVPRSVFLAALGTLLAIPAAPCGAQNRLEPDISSPERINHLLINGAIGGVSAAFIAAARGKNPLRAIIPGIAGGVLVGAGKQVAGTKFSGSGLFGRQVAAGGISVIRSVGEDTAVVFVPVGPLTLEVRPRAFNRVRPRVNLFGVGTILYYVLRDDTDFALGESFSAGAPAFRFPTATVSSADGLIYGRMDFGAILLGARVSEPSLSQHYTLNHESIHVIQFDYMNYVFAHPLERALLARIPFGERFTRNVDLGILAPLLAAAVHTRLQYDRRPWEREATLMSEGDKE